ncbi:hypothetical protein BU14_0686s0005 [Porphyra umbilicalis]|uniref:Uncharacterized protein n=1 Tax=Porphyra umbilicalis TaxID=2786 RepID=A0A1X6NQ32_PORUM|nr:hypothetical protein BU14_0686s0005 [Porphyra umbilicalis]|eukprot:OSX70701.1 hypothetical protein BU14_0686s0005 [Porphyra umbilicalis]
MALHGTTKAHSVRIFKQTLATHRPGGEGSRTAGGSCRRPHHRCRRGHHRGGRTRPTHPSRARPYATARDQHSRGAVGRRADEATSPTHPPARASLTGAPPVAVPPHSSPPPLSDGGRAPPPLGAGKGAGSATAASPAAAAAAVAPAIAATATAGVRTAADAPAADGGAEFDGGLPAAAAAAPNCRGRGDRDGEDLKRCQQRPTAGLQRVRPPPQRADGAVAVPRPALSATGWEPPLQSRHSVGAPSQGPPPLARARRYSSRRLRLARRNRPPLSPRVGCDPKRVPRRGHAARRTPPPPSAAPICARIALAAPPVGARRVGVRGPRGRGPFPFCCLSLLPPAQRGGRGSAARGSRGGRRLLSLRSPIAGGSSGAVACPRPLLRPPRAEVACLGRRLADAAGAGGVVAAAADLLSGGARGGRRRDDGVATGADAVERRCTCDRSGCLWSRRLFVSLA